MGRRRLDVELVRRGLAPSRQVARALVEARRIRVAGAVAEKPARMVDPGEPVVVVGEPDPFVGRGGHKLAAALDHFALDVTGRRALDAGASTGGFTDCLLQRGVAEVVAVDVGHGQLHPRLREDPRVLVRERCHVRDLRLEDLPGRRDLAVADLSFISLRRALPPICAVCAPDAVVIVLVKPQFEAGRVEAARARGVITDPTVWRRVLVEVMSALRGEGAAIMGAMPSPLRGADGNVEFLVAARLQAGGPADLPAIAEGAVRDVERA